MSHKLTPPGNVGIVGGGIGGLTVAACLADAGVACEIFEKTSLTDEFGAGIQLTPNATTVFKQLGLLDAIAAIASVPERLIWHHGKSGRTITELAYDTTPDKRCSAPYFQVHRRSLVRVLADHLANLSTVSIHECEEALSCSVTHSAARLNTSQRHQDFDCVIAADGMGSKLRHALATEHDPIHSGFCAHRALIPLHSVPHLYQIQATRLWVDKNRHIVTYPLHHEQVLNCVFVTPEQRQDSTSWRQQGSVEDLAALFKSWSTHTHELIDCIDPERLFCWSLFEHSSVRVRSTRSNCVLIGDAAHTFLPYLAQGAAMAIEDSAVLAECLVMPETTIADAVFNYHQQRASRLRRVYAITRRNGIAYHLGAGLSKLRNLMIPYAFRQIVKEIYAHDVYANTT